MNGCSCTILKINNFQIDELLLWTSNATMFHALNDANTIISYCLFWIFVQRTRTTFITFESLQLPILMLFDFLCINKNFTIQQCYWMFPLQNMGRSVIEASVPLKRWKDTNRDHWMSKSRQFRNQVMQKINLHICSVYSDALCRCVFEKVLVFDLFLLRLRT